MKRALLAVPAVALVALAGCTLPGVHKGSAGAHLNSNDSSGSNDISSRIADLTSEVKSAKTSTFRATYTSEDKSTITIEQAPPKTYFATSDGTTFFSDGTHSYVCSSSGNEVNCFSSGTGANPVAGLTEFFNPDNAVAAWQAFQSEALAKAAGYDVSFSDATFAGQSASCLSAKHANATERWCVTRSGLLAAIESGSSKFELTSYTTNVNQKDFELPAGAHVSSIPGQP